MDHITENQRIGSYRCKSTPDQLASRSIMIERATKGNNPEIDNIIISITSLKKISITSIHVMDKLIKRIRSR